MRPVILSDINADALRATAEEFQSSFGPDAVESVVADVASADDNERMAARAFERHGDLAFLFLNAGIIPGPSGYDSTWTTSPEDYHRLLAVDMHSVYYGIRAFVPRLLKQRRPCLVLGTASVAGLFNASQAVPFTYVLAKHGVLLMLENLAAALREQAPQHSAAVLCPFMTETKMTDKMLDASDPIQAAAAQFVMPVSACVARLERELRRGAFYIVTPDKKSDVEQVVTQMSLKRGAVARGLPAERHLLRQFRPDVRAASAAAKEECAARAKL